MPEYEIRWIFEQFRVDLQCNSWKLNSAIGILKSSRNDYKFHYSRWETIFLVALFIDLIEAKWQKTIYRHIICLLKYYTNMKKFDQYFFFVHIFLCARFLSFPHITTSYFSSVRFPSDSPHFSFLRACHFLSSQWGSPYLHQIYTICKIEFTFFFKWHWLENAMNSQHRWGWMRQRKQ